MAATRSIRKRRYRHWKKNPHCRDCGILTILPEKIPQSKRTVKLTPNMATLEHLRSRFDPSRTVPNVSNEIRTTLLCGKCNNERGRIEQKNLSREECLERSTRPRKTKCAP